MAGYGQARYAFCASCSWGGAGDGRTGRRGSSRRRRSRPPAGVKCRPRAGNQRAQDRVRAGTAGQERVRRESRPGAPVTDLRGPGHGHRRPPLGADRGRAAADTCPGAGLADDEKGGHVERVHAHSHRDSDSDRLGGRCAYRCPGTRLLAISRFRRGDSSCRDHARRGTGQATLPRAATAGASAWRARSAARGTGSAPGTEQPPQAGHGPQHAAEAVRSRRCRPRLSGSRPPRPRRPGRRGYAIGCAGQ